MNRPITLPADLARERVVTPAEELRAAAAKLRTPLPPYLAASTPRLIQSDSEAIDAVAWCAKPDHEPYTDCDHCHVVEAHDARLAELIVALYQAREPLASLLETTASIVAQVAARSGGATVYEPEALTVARVINGSTSCDQAEAATGGEGK